MKNTVALGFSALMCLFVSGCATGQPAETALGGGSVKFACGNGENVEMQFRPGEKVGVLLRSGWSTDLPRQPTTSGYSFSNGLTRVDGKGSEMSIQVAHLAPLWCHSRSVVVAGNTR